MEPMSIPRAHTTAFAERRAAKRKSQAPKPVPVPPSTDTAMGSAIRVIGIIGRTNVRIENFFKFSTLGNQAQQEIPDRHDALLLLLSNSAYESQSGLDAVVTDHVWGHSTSASTTGWRAGGRGS